MKLSNLLRIPFSILGYAWGVGIPLLMLVLFLGLNEWSFRFSELPFMQIHPRYSGGEVIKKIDDGGVRYALHRLVRDGLVGERADGFLQIDVTLSDTVKYPIETSFDFDMDGIQDFRLRFETPECTSPSLESFVPEITSFEQYARTTDGWVVRLRYEMNFQPINN